VRVQAALTILLAISTQCSRFIALFLDGAVAFQCNSHFGL
jgi:hypothetical protein